MDMWSFSGGFTGTLHAGAIHRIRAGRTDLSARQYNGPHRPVTENWNRGIGAHALVPLLMPKCPTLTDTLRGGE